MAKKRARKTKRSPSRASRKSSSRVSAKTSSSNKVPVLAKLISILVFIYTAFTLILGVILLIAGIAGSTVFSLEELATQIVNNPLESYIIQYFLISIILAGIVFFALGVLEFLIARGLWRGRNWARITMIVLMTVGFISAILAFDIITMILTLLIGSYLLLNKDVKKAYR